MLYGLCPTSPTTTAGLHRKTSHIPHHPHFSMVAVSTPTPIPFSPLRQSPSCVTPIAASAPLRRLPILVTPARIISARREGALINILVFESFGRQKNTFLHFPPKTMSENSSNFN
ncbi:unnamed protein product [Sphenostylis stenocarpa]|uniref:Uncharacterized protein n=1 Tax=Sphenostylis stenocarpa TaxID=92480 RepID=A0AA86T6A9_9FABA|nr:unnamed protein product [Sphenostylis stenocarpa]